MAIARELRSHPKAAEVVNLIGAGSKVRRSPLEIGHIRIGSGWKRSYRRTSCVT
jgi:hypothetical protein